MTGTGTQPVTNEVPESAWVLGWACLAGQVVTLFERGLTDAFSALLSAPLSALVVAWVSYGVLRARTFRTWLAGIILLLVALFGVVALALGPSLLGLAGAAAGVVAVAALVAYTRTDCFAALRAEPRRPGPAFGGLVALAVAVGLLGGVTAAAPDDRNGDGFHVRLGL